MIIKKIILAIILCTVFFIISKGQNNDCLDQFSWYNKTSPNGNFILYHVTNNSAFIEYGNKSFHRLLPEKYDCDIADSRIPHFEWDNHNFIVLRYGCGSPCWGILILPLDSEKPVRNIMFEMAFDSLNNLVGYLDCENYNSLIIENLKTNQASRIDFPFKTDHGEFIGYWIDSIVIKDQKLYYRYSDPNDDNKEKIHTKVEIDIPFK